MKILLKISYLGTNYCGYQVQPNGDTVQARLNTACLEVFGYPCDVVGCSRTDSGVHANVFYATVAKKRTETLETTIPEEKLPLALSAHLPEDIAVLRAQWVDENFHARYGVEGKEYIYRICNAPVMSPFEQGRAAHLPQVLGEEAIIRMNQAAKLLLGEHDFTSYMAQGSKITDAVRTITFSEVRKDGDMIVYRVRSNGFLYHMVRILMGTLVEVGLGKRKPEDILAVTEAKDRTVAGFTMPACGLYLNSVTYCAENGIHI